MFKRLISTTLAFGLAALAPPAYAMSCAPRDGMVQRLETQYKETLTARGLQNADSLLEIFSSKETGSYTVLLSRADGISCVVSSGTHWISEDAPTGVKS